MCCIEIILIWQFSCSAYQPETPISVWYGSGLEIGYNQLIRCFVSLVVHPSVFHFQMIWVNNGFSPNLVYALILWRFGLGLLMGKFRQKFYGVFCPSHVHIFVSINSGKHQWIFIKLGMCIDIVEIGLETWYVHWYCGDWFGIANGQISSVWQSCLPKTRPHFHFSDDNFSKCQGILTKLGTCIDMKILFGIAYGQISSMIDRVICLWHDNGGVF